MLLLAGWHRGYDIAVEVLLAVLVAAHQLEQFLDIARADVDHDVLHALQKLLQLRELPAADRHRLAIVGVDAFHRDDLAVGNARREQMTGHRGLADVARVVDDGELHGVSLVGKRGLISCEVKNASALSLPRRPPASLRAPSACGTAGGAGVAA